MTKQGHALLLTVIMIAMSMAPMASGTGARANPDFIVSSFTLDGAGSILEDGVYILEPSTHTVRVQVQNIGLAGGQATLTLYHQGSPSSGEVAKSVIDLGVIASGASTSVLLIDWSASVGDEQTLRAVVSSTSDPNSGNNDQSLFFNVQQYQAASVPSTTGIPLVDVGESNVVWSKTTHTFGVNARNDGVVPFSAYFDLLFTEVADPSNTFTETSGTLPAVQPGSLYSGGATAELISYAFDASGYSGEYTVVGTLHISSLAGSESIEFLNQQVLFSNYDFQVLPALNRSIEPGQSTTLTYLITNVGTLSDEYGVSLTSVSGWADTSAHGTTTATISPDVTTSVLVQVDVPSDALRTESETVTLQLTSTSGYARTVSTTILAGESYEPVVTMPSTVVEVTPGKTVNIVVNIANDGNSASNFMLMGGLSANPVNWNLEMSSTTTGMLAPGENVDISLDITAPIIKYPLVPNEHNRAGDSMSVWIQAQSLQGGIPAIDATPLEIRPVVVVDPGLPTSTIEMTAEQVIAARNGVGLEEVLGLNVEVRHNLISDLSETVDATIALGTPTFEALTSGGNLESTRWSAGISPTAFADLTLGSSHSGVLTIQGPADDYPVAGILEIPITTTPTLSSVHQGSNVFAEAITQTLSVTIPSVMGAESTLEGPLDVMVGEKTAFDLALANTGNDVTSYRLSLMNTLPDNWVASFSNATSMTATTITNLAPKVAAYPNENTDHHGDYVLSITTDPMALANSVEYLGIRVQHLETGAFIAEYQVPIRVGEKVNAELGPTNHTVNLSGGESVTTRVVISNIGNTPASFSIWLDGSQSEDVIFALETPSMVDIGAGYEDTIRIRVTAIADARSGMLHMATVWVSNSESGLNKSANIVANISEDRAMQVETDDNIGVIPGEDKEIDFTLTNNGNLAESIVIEIKVSGGWGVTPSNQSRLIEIDEVIEDSFIIDVPSLSGGDDMRSGVLYPVTIRVLDPELGYEELESHSFNLVIAPVFEVQINDWPNEMYYHANIDRTWDVEIKNTGNRKVTMNVEYELLRGGLTVPTDDWVLDENAPQTLTLEVNQTKDFIFTVQATKPDPDLTLAADLIVTLTPMDANVDGDAQFTTTLMMKRFFELGDTDVLPPEDDGAVAYNILYSHIPNGPADTVAYEVELCSAQRLINLDAMGVEEEDFPWVFKIRVDDTDYPLDLTQECDPGASLGDLTRIQLPARTSYVTTNPIKLIVDAPNRPNMLPGDGWDLTLRLYHPTENAGYTVYDEATFTYALAVFADPAIIDFGPVDGEIIEGELTQYRALIRNQGTAIALGVSASLSCPGFIEILDSPDTVISMAASNESEFFWTVKAATIDWWETSKTSECTLQLDAMYMDGNLESNDVEIIDQTVTSASPGVSTSFIAFVVLFLVSVAFLRLAGQSEKWQLAGIYAGVLACGFAFHLLDYLYYGPAVLVLTALWIWRMTWKSSEEFRQIHEDYQRARKGISTIYSDHFDSLADSRRQLTIILSLPVLGMLAVVLGLPPQLSSDQQNLVVMASYFFIIVFGVWYLLKRSDKLYGNLYGRMTDAEIRAIRIERDLSDPARLLNDLAEDGLDLGAILGAIPSASTAGGSGKHTVSLPQSNVASSGKDYVEILEIEESEYEDDDEDDEFEEFDDDEDDEEVMDGE